MSSGRLEWVLVAQRLADQGEGLAGDVALEDSQGVVAAVAAGFASCGELAGSGVVDHAVVRDGPQGVVGRSVPSAVEAVAVGLTAAGLDGADTAQGGEGCVIAEAFGVTARGHQQLGGGVDPDPGSGQQGGCGSPHDGADRGIEFEDLGVQL